MDMNDFNELKALSRQSFELAQEKLEESNTAAIRARHLLDQAEGGVTQLEALLAEAPESAKPDIARDLEATRQSAGEVSRLYDTALAEYQAAASNLERARQSFIEAFHEEP